MHELAEVSHRYLKGSSKYRGRQIEAEAGKEGCIVRIYEGVH